MVVAYLIASGFTGVFLMAVDTIFICFCEYCKILYLYKFLRYSGTSIIRTPMCQFNHKSVQITEFVQINESHSFIFDHLSKNPSSLHNF